MGMLRYYGILAIIPATVLLTISFFVLFTLRKPESQGVKAFGYVIAALLWVSSAIVLGAGIHILSSGRCPMMGITKHSMESKMDCQMMQDGSEMKHETNRRVMER